MAVISASVAEVVEATDVNLCFLIPAAITVRVVDPRYIDVQHWTRLMTATLLPHGQVPRWATEQDWHFWAQQARQIPALGQAHIPDPRGYVSWREWAFAFNAAIWGAGLGIP